MKKLLLMALFCAVTATSKAQIAELNINRNIDCDVWIEFLGSDGTCGVSNTTGPILYSGMPTGTISGLTTASFTWLSAPDPTHFLAAIIYSGDPSNPDCPVSSVTIGVSSCFYPSSDFIDFYDSECRLCRDGEFHVEWNGTIDATIEIN